MAKTRPAKRARRGQLPSAGAENARPVVQSNDSHESGISGAEVAPATTPNQQVRIFTVPREIFDEIIHHLSVVALACFALTCKEGLQLVGTSPWRKLRWTSRKNRQNAERMYLLTLLHLDLPGAYLCPRCVMLHPLIRLRPPSAYRSVNLHRTCLIEDGVIDYWQGRVKGYILTLHHIHAAFESRTDSDSGLVARVSPRISPPIRGFSGDHTIFPKFGRYQLRSSARWIERNLVVRHEHHLRPGHFSRPVRADDVTSLPLQLCPHLVTVKSPPPRPQGGFDPGWQFTNEQWLFTYAVSRAFPEEFRAPFMDETVAAVLRTLPPAFKAQIRAAEKDRGDGFVWRCSQCATKFCVRYEARSRSGLVVTSWHCFGKELYQAETFWRNMIHRGREGIGSTWGLYRRDDVEGTGYVYTRKHIGGIYSSSCRRIRDFPIE